MYEPFNAPEKRTPAHSQEPVLIGEILPGLFRELAEGVPPDVAWKYRSLADHFELREEQEAA